MPTSDPPGTPNVASDDPRTLFPNATMYLLAKEEESERNSAAADSDSVIAQRLMVLCARDEIMDVLDGKGDLSLAKKSLRLLVEMLAAALPSAKQLGEQAERLDRILSLCHTKQDRIDAIIEVLQFGLGANNS